MGRLSEFEADLKRSGLVSPPDLAKARARLDQGANGDDPVKLARLLVEQGSLTTYQASKVLAGQTKGFFLGNYRILRRLGSGGMGKVYLAVREADGQKVAIKVLPPKKAQEEENALARFRREMELSQRVRHKYLARTLDVGEDGDVHFMVMEYIPGDSLYNIVKSDRGGPLRVPDAARYFLKIVDGLNAAHAANLVHRDIKPSNLMVTPDSDARILDLGLARALEEESNPLTHPNAVIGTLDYASPEQLSNAASADRRSDLYSLGCTLYFALTGRAPFEGGDIVNKIFKHRMEDPEPLERVAKGVPAAFAAIVRKLMAKNPSERYQAGQELQADLARWTDPAVVRAILGAEAETARAFRPPPPELDDEDLRLLAEGADEPSSVALRDLGDAEPGFAPLHRIPTPPRKAVFRSTATAPPRRLTTSDDTRWLIRFTVIAFVIGGIAILLLSLLF